MLDICSGGRNIKVEVFPFKGLKWAEAGGGAGWGGSASAGGHYSFRGLLPFKIPFFLPSHTAQPESKKTFAAPSRDRHVSPSPAVSNLESRCGGAGGCTLQISLLDSLNIVAAKQVTGADRRQLTCPGRNPLNSLTPLSPRNASALRPTTRS